MLHPGSKCCYSVVLLIFSSRACSLSSGWFHLSNLTSSLNTWGSLLTGSARSLSQAGEKDILLPLLPPNSRLEDGTQRGGRFFFSLCLLSVCEVAEQGSRLWEALGKRISLKRTKLPRFCRDPRLKETPGASHPAPRELRLPGGGPGMKGERRARLLVWPRASSPRVGSFTCGKAAARCAGGGEMGCLTLPPHQLGLSCSRLQPPVRGSY